MVRNIGEARLCGLLGCPKEQVEIHHCIDDGPATQRTIIESTNRLQEISASIKSGAGVFLPQPARRSAMRAQQ